MNTAPHNFILTHSYYKGDIVFFFQLYFTLILLVLFFSKVFFMKKTSFEQFIFFGIFIHLSYKMFQNPGIFNVDLFVKLFVSLLTVCIRKKKIYHA